LVSRLAIVVIIKIIIIKITTTKITKITIITTTRYKFELLYQSNHL